MILKLNDANFVNSLVHHDMAYCFNDNCPKASTCFRHTAAKFKNPNMKMGKAIFPDALEDGKCNHFIRPRIIQAAWGLDSLYDEVRHQDANTMKSQVMSLLGGKTSYYRYHRGDKLLTPELQDAVQALFVARGYDKPTFKHYKETIDFTDKEEEKSFT